MELSCNECSRPFTPDPENPRSHCFKCHIGNGPTFRFVGGGGYGRQAFHDNTVGEVQREIVEASAARGIKAEPVGARWV